MLLLITYVCLYNVCRFRNQVGETRKFHKRRTHRHPCGNFSSIRIHLPQKGTAIHHPAAHHRQPNPIQPTRPSSASQTMAYLSPQGVRFHKIIPATPVHHHRTVHNRLGVNRQKFGKSIYLSTRHKLFLARWPFLSHSLSSWMHFYHSRKNNRLLFVLSAEALHLVVILSWNKIHRVVKLTTAFGVEEFDKLGWKNKT